MTTPYIGEIRTFAGTFAPVGWAFCDGALLPIAQNEALFTLIGTTYGGDGINTFAVPDLRGRVPVGLGPGYTLGASAGQERVTLTAAHAPAHTHPLRTAAAPAGTSKLPGGYPAAGPVVAFDDDPAPATAALDASTIAAVGGGAPHENMAPFLTLSFIIALQGIYPSQA